MRTLHRPVDCVYEFTNMVFKSRLDKTFGLFHVDILLGKTIEICSNEVDLPEFKIEFSSNSSSDPYRLESSYASPCLIIINLELLGISLSYQPRLILDSVPFTIPLYIVDPS